MMSEGSITHWIGALKQGDPAAAQRLWNVYFYRLVVLARARLRDVPRRAADEEDVALSAFDSFCRGAERGRFAQLDDRDDLWQHPAAGCHTPRRVFCGEPGPTRPRRSVASCCEQG
jgi:hypothetical protein